MITNKDITSYGDIRRMRILSDKLSAISATRSNIASLMGMAMLVTLTACSEAEIILPGDREAVLPEAGFISIDNEAALEGAGLSEQTLSSDARHPGITGSHSGGHLSLDGALAQRWRASVEGVPDETVELPQPLIIGSQVLAIGADAALTAFSLDTGEVNWTRFIDERNDDPLPGVAGGLASNGELIIAHAAYNRLEAISVETGELVWSIAHDQPLRGGPTMTDVNSVVVTDIDGRIYVYRINDGELLWQRAGLPVNTIVFGVASPAAASERIVIAGAAGEVAVHNSLSGDLIWADSLASFNPRTPLEELGDIRAHPVVRDGAVFVISQSGRMVSYQLNSGFPIWEKSVGGIEMPWVAGQTVFVLTLDGRLYALRDSDGAARWVAELEGAVPLGKIASSDVPRYIGPIVAENRVYVASASGNLLSYNAETGVRVNSRSLGGTLTTPPQIGQGVMAILLNSGELQILD